MKQYDAIRLAMSLVVQVAFLYCATGVGMATPSWPAGEFSMSGQISSPPADLAGYTAKVNNQYWVSNDAASYGTNSLTVEITRAGLTAQTSPSIHFDTVDSGVNKTVVHFVVQGPVNCANKRVKVYFKAEASAYAEVGQSDESTSASACFRINFAGLEVPLQNAHFPDSGSDRLMMWNPTPRIFRRFVMLDSAARADVAFPVGLHLCSQAYSKYDNTFAPATSVRASIAISQIAVIKVVSGIEDSYEKVDAIVSSSPDLFHYRLHSHQPPDPGPYSVQCERGVGGDISVQSGVDWALTYSLDSPCFDTDYCDPPLRMYSWSAQHEFRALPNPAGLQLPFTNPRYAWEYHLDGNPLSSTVGGWSPEIIHQDGVDPSRAVVKVEFGSNPAPDPEYGQLLPPYPQDKWPKSGLVTVTVTDGDGIVPDRLVNDYKVKWHLPSENWQKDPAEPLMPNKWADEVPELVIQTDPVSDDNSVHGESDTIKIWATPNEFRFYAGLTDDQKEILGMVAETAVGIATDGLFTALDFASPLLENAFVKSAISYGISSRGLHVVENYSQRDTKIIVNEYPFFYDALHASPTRVILPEGYLEASVSSGNENFNDNDVWANCKMTAGLAYEEHPFWYIGDGYDKNGYCSHKVICHLWQPKPVRPVAFYHLWGQGSW